MGLKLTMPSDGEILEYEYARLEESAAQHQRQAELFKQQSEDELARKQHVLGIIKYKKELHAREDEKLRHNLEDCTLR